MKLFIILVFAIAFPITTSAILAVGHSLRTELTRIYLAKYLNPQSFQTTYDLLCASKSRCSLIRIVSGVIFFIFLILF